MFAYSNLSNSTVSVKANMYSNNSICFDIAFAYDKIASYTFNHLFKFLVNIHQFVMDIR